MRVLFTFSALALLARASRLDDFSFRPPYNEVAEHNGMGIVSQHYQNRGHMEVFDYFVRLTQDKQVRPAASHSFALTSTAAVPSRAVLFPPSTNMRSREFFTRVRDVLH